jgi:GNAT superfamily N-acetyltransferase
MASDRRTGVPRKDENHYGDGFVKFRPFKPEDAVFCFQLRSNAFIRKFYGELTGEEVAAAVNAYMPDDYIRMARKNPIFIIEKDDTPTAFFSLKRIGEHTAELPLIYIDLDGLGAGIGTACVDYIENWLNENWPEVDALIVDTVIPKYNSGFYKKQALRKLSPRIANFWGERLKHCV